MKKWRKGYVGVPPLDTAKPEGEDGSGGPKKAGRGNRVNAELQHAPAAIGTRQVGVPAF